MAKYEVKYGQSIYDIATEVYGSVLGVENIFRDNSDIDATTVLEVGREIDVNPTSETIYDQSIVDYFKFKTITNSESQNSGITDTVLGGFNYGVINTQRTAFQRYINDIMWRNLGELELFNGQNESVFTDGDNGTFNDATPSGWNTTEYPYDAANPNHAGGTVVAQTINIDGELFQSGGFNFGAPAMNVADMPFLTQDFSTAINASIGTQYEISAKVITAGFQCEASIRGNAQVVLMIEGYDLEDLDSYATQVISTNLSDYEMGSAKTIFTATSETFRVRLGLLLKLDTNPNTGGAFYLDDLVVRPISDASSVSYDRVKFDQPYNFNKNGDYMDIYIKAKDFPVGISQYVLLGDYEGESKIVIKKDGSGLFIQAIGDNGATVYTSGYFQPLDEIKFRIECVVMVGASVQKDYVFSLNTTPTTDLNISYNITLNAIGGDAEIGDGFEGFIQKFEANGDVYDFNEGKDIYIIKN